MATETMIFEGYEYARRDIRGEVIETGAYDDLWVRLRLNMGENLAFRALYATEWVEVT
jgi:hypothetical protein